MTDNFNALTGAAKFFASDKVAKPDGGKNFVQGTSQDASRRYTTLDALRGVAALIVVLFHSGIHLGTWVPRFGYLAVDLFFILSGFVIAHAYDRRLGSQLGPFEFLRIRAVRLYPLYFMGLVLGASVAVINVELSDVTLKNVGINFAINLFGFPSPEIERFQLEGYRQLFPLNVPFWSLFLEFWVANLIFALLRRVPDWRVLLSIIVASAVGLLVSEKIFYTMDLGASWNYVAEGLPRVCFSFFGGVAISRLSRLIAPRSRPPAWLLVVVLPIILSCPLDGRMAHFYELACVLFIFPLLIYFGAAAIALKPKVGEVLGDASYAIYTIHFPLLMAVRWTLAKISVDHSLIIQFCFALALIPPAWALSYIDFRLRKWLLRPTH
jgi:peptidoglycan/LPS O-acetylase OafA/YrhL